jgi:hypothetical protein
MLYIKISMDNPSCNNAVIDAGLQSASLNQSAPEAVTSRLVMRSAREMALRDRPPLRTSLRVWCIANLADLD